MSAEEEDGKEWVKVTHAANGTTSVTVSRMEDNLSVKWTVKTYASTIKPAVGEARTGARKAMQDLRQALEKLEEEEAA